MVDQNSNSEKKPAIPQVGVRVINFQSAEMIQRAGESSRTSSQQMDPFEEGYKNKDILPPPVDPESLIAVCEDSDVLTSCIDAMKVNIGGFGYELVPVQNREEGSTEQKAADEERRRIEQFFKFINPQMPFSELRARTRKDLETTGNAYWEIIENVKGDKIVGIEHVPAQTMRLTPLHEAVVDGTSWVQNEGREWEEIVYPRRYRRFVQITDGDKKRYFKEYGDPRFLNYQTGDYSESSFGELNAHSVIHFKIYTPRSAYGLPRWVGATFEALGRTKASKVNYNYFGNKAVPPLAILVSGGQITSESIARIQDVFKSLKGEDNFYSIPIIEALPADSQTIDDTGSKGAVRIELKPLSEAMERDGIFLEYKEKAKGDVRSTFRIPPIFLGLSDDYTRATAEASQSVGEEQVFQPERMIEDFIINQQIFPAMGFKYWQFKTKGASVANDEVLADLLNAGKENAAITPNEARSILAKLFGMDLKPLKDDQANQPIKFAEIEAFPADAFLSGEQSADGNQAVRVVKSVLAMRRMLEGAM